MSQSAAPCGGNRRRWQRLWSSGLTGGTCCIAQSSWRPTNTAKRQRDGEMSRRRQRQKDLSMNKWVSCMEMGSMWGRLAQENQVRTELHLLVWNCRVSFLSMLLLPSMLPTSCKRKNLKSLWCDEEQKTNICWLVTFTAVKMQHTMSTGWKSIWPRSCFSRLMSSWQDTLRNQI